MMEALGQSRVVRKGALGDVTFEQSQGRPDFSGWRSQRRADLAEEMDHTPEAVQKKKKACTNKTSTRHLKKSKPEKNPTKLDQSAS